MKVSIIEQPKVIMQNSRSKHNYFAWPTVARLKNGKIAVAASGYRQAHACPFGKAVISFSEDEGKTYTNPTPIIDTVSDDRDGGLTAFGESGVILTSFCNSLEFQKKHASEYGLAYIATVDPEEATALEGSHFCVSHDNGISFGDLIPSPVSSPHGPFELSDGTILWMGNINSKEEHLKGETGIWVYKILPDGKMEYQGKVENTHRQEGKPFYAEPHCIELPDGTLIAHIRIQKNGVGRYEIFSLAQTESYDKGKTWTAPHLILDDLGGAPGHLFRHSSGMLVCTYGCRQAPVGIKAAFSADNGKTWDINHNLYINAISGDLGYPSTIELRDGSLLTVFYAHPNAKEDPAVIMQMNWTFDLAGEGNDADEEFKRRNAQTENQEVLL